MPERKEKIFSLVFFVIYLISQYGFGQKINQFNEAHQRTGIWKKYYPNKKIRYSGTFKNGKEVGIFKFYNNSSFKYPIVIKSYSETSDTISVQFFSVKGVLESNGTLVGKKREGKWNYFFSDGSILSEENYKENKLEGVLKNYYPNGTITEITIYKNGLKEGVSKKYSSKGVLIEEITFEKNKPNGMAKYFELNGNLKEAGIYKNGNRVGKWQFYMDGKPTNKNEERTYFKNKEE